MAADLVMQMKEVTLTAVNRITREVKRLSKSMRKVNDDRQTCSEDGPWANRGPED